MTNNKDSLNDFFKSIGGEKKKLKEEKKKIIGDLSLDNLFSSMEEESRKLKEEKKQLKKDVEAFKNLLFKEEKKEEKPVVKEEPIVEEIEVEEEEVKEETVVEHAVKILDKINEEVETVETEPDLAKLKKEIEVLKQVVYEQGGGGEVRLEFLDDVDRDSVKVDGKFLKYQSSTGKFIGADASGGGGSVGAAGTWAVDSVGINTSKNVGIGTEAKSGFALDVSGNVRIIDISSRHINSTGVITATSFSGDGSGLTGVASTDNIITGTAATFNNTVNFNSPILVNNGVSLSGVTTGLNVSGVGTIGTLQATNATISGNLSIGGTLTYEDVTSIDSVGLITARNGMVVSGVSTFLGSQKGVNVSGISTFTGNVTLPDNVELKLGSAGEVRLYHTGNNTNFIVSQHYFNMQANGYQLFSQNGSESIITAYQNGAVNLFFDNTKRIETTNTGAVVTGILTATSFSGNITGNITGNADTATALETARTIGGVSFDGTGNINLPGVNAAGNQDTTGNAATATALETARTIGGVSFDGSASINLPGVNASGNQDTSGNAATATALETARTIGGVSFDGTGNINLPGVNSSGNQDTSGNAATATVATNAQGLTGTPSISVVDISSRHVNSSGIITATSFVGNVTGNVSGNLTGTSAVVGSAVTVNSTGVDAGAGIVTATKFSGNTAQGGGNDSVFQMNGMTVTQDFEFPDGQSAMSVGPITINSGVEVTVPDGQNWVIL